MLIRLKTPAALSRWRRMRFADLVGYIAATLTTLSFLPQVIHIWRKRTAEGVSLFAFSVFGLGVALWLAYGLMRRDAPIVVANTITFILILSVIYCALRFRRKT